MPIESRIGFNRSIQGEAIMAIKRRQTVWLLGGIAWLLLAGCAQKDEKSQTQVLARVNNAEITVLELNSVLSQRPDLKGDSNNQRQQALDYLVDQEVLVQKAADLKLDQEPAVLAAIEAGRRQVLAAAAAPPNPASMMSPISMRSTRAGLPSANCSTLSVLPWPAPRSTPSC
jgi:hypothetical protein